MKQKIKIDIHRMGSENDFITRLVASVNSGKAWLSINSLMGYLDTRQAAWSEIGSLCYKQSGNKIVVSEDGCQTFTLTLEWVETNSIKEGNNDIPDRLFSSSLAKEALKDEQ